MSSGAVQSVPIGFRATLVASNIINNSSFGTLASRRCPALRKNSTPLWLLVRRVQRLLPLPLPLLLWLPAPPCHVLLLLLCVSPLLPQAP